MALTVISRPSKDIDSITSTWNAVNLPIQYKFNSDLFPTNTVDAIEAATTTNNKGFLQLDILNPLTNILGDETVNLTDCNIESFNGVWRIKEKINDTSYVLFVSYDSALVTVNMQKYYNNYFSEVRVYSGLPAWHSESASKPISNVGTLRSVPDPDNNIIASFSGVIKADVSAENSLDLNFFTGFYVEWREGYDQNVSGNIDTFYTDYEIDEVDDCGQDKVINGDFVTDLANWTQVDAAIPSEPFIWDAGLAKSNLGTLRKSTVIYQELNLVANIEYSVSVDITRSNDKYSNFVVYGTNDLLNYNILLSDSSIDSLTVSGLVVPSSNYKYVGFHFYRNSVVVSDVTVDNIIIVPSVCEYTFWASNSSLQFQNSRGGNMYDYISGRADSKFMTNFNTPTLFKGDYFSLSMILNNNLLDESDLANQAAVWFNGEDLGANGTDITSWEDRTGNVIGTGDVGNEPTVTSFGVNNNKSAIYDGISQRLVTSPFLVGELYTLYLVLRMEYTVGSYLIFQLNGLSMFLLNPLDPSDPSDIVIQYGNDVIFIPITLDQDYVIKIVSNGADSRVLFNNELVWSGSLTGVPLDMGGFLGFAGFDGVISEFIAMNNPIEKCLNWQIEAYLGVKYDTYDSSLIGFQKTEFDSLGNELDVANGYVDYKDDGLYRMSVDVSNDLTSKIEYNLTGVTQCNLSETKTINVDSSCSNQGIYLTWLNELGGWDYWKFTAEKDYNLNIESKETIKRNIFNDWDNDFINGDTEMDVINSSAYSEVGVFSQYLNEDEVLAISAIKYSPKVQVIDGVKKTTVIVDSDSILLFNDGDDETLHTIRFNIRYPNIQIQSQ